MITISQLAYRMKRDDQYILDIINKKKSGIKAKNGMITNRNGIIIGLSIFLDISLDRASKFYYKYKAWKKKYKDNV